MTKRLGRVFPLATTAELSDLRARLTANRTFSHLALQYGLTRSLVFRQAQSNRKSTRDDEQRLSANALEAYCGAVIESNGGNETAIVQWLDALLSPAVFPAFDHISKSIETGSAEGSAKRPRLETGDSVRDAENRTSSGRRAVVERKNHMWIDEYIPGMRWASTLKVSGEQVGSGIGPKIHAAREVALEEFIDSLCPSCAKGASPPRDGQT